MKKQGNTFNHILYICSSGLVSVTLVSFLGLISSSAVASSNTVVTTTNIIVAESCSMSGSTGSNHNATLINGTYSGTNYASGIGESTLKVFCNDNNGFAIYAIGYTNEEYGNNKLHWSGAASDDNTNAINTGIYNASTTTNSTWSMKLSSVAGTYAATIDDGVAAHNSSTEDFTNWHVVPSEYKRVAYRTSGTDLEVNGSGTGSSVKVTYDAYISQEQPAGTYTGLVKYTLVHPYTADAPVIPLTDSDCPAGYVCYAPNASGIEGSMATLGAIASSDKAGRVNLGTSATTADLIAPNYKRSGYGFAGWSTDFEATNSSIIYGPNETITVDLSNSGLILYPVWVENAGNLQGWNSCSSLTTAPTNARATLSSVTALTDTRDGNVYTVARLADGKCWTIENLRLDDSATLTVTNTHNPLHDANNIVTLKIDYANNVIADHLATPSGTWCTNYNSATCLDQTMLNNNNTNISDSSLTASYNTNNATSKWYGYGNYYNWYSATAGNGTYDFGNGVDSVNGDLCPTGWHLPYGGNGTGASGGNTAGGFYYLNTQLSNTTDAQGSKDWRTFPNNFIFSGRWIGTATDNRSSFGYYWSSLASGTYTSGSGAYELKFSYTNLNPGTNNSLKDYGAAAGDSVRCVVDN